jgi:hypothetical protein
MMLTVIDEIRELRINVMVVLRSDGLEIRSKIKQMILSSR